MTHLLASPRSTAALVLALVLAASCQVVPDLTVTPRYGTREVSGDLLITSGPATSTADAEVLGLEEDDGVFSPRVELSWLGFDLWASGSSALYEGEGTLEETFDLGGITIMIGDDVASSLDLTTAQVAITWDLVPTDALDVGLGVGVAYFDFEAEITSLTTSQTLRTAEEFVMPVLAARIEGDIGPVRANVVGAGLTGSYEGAEGTYFDVDAFLEYELSDLVGFHLGIQVGYQAAVFDFEYDDDDGRTIADLTFEGPYVGLSLGT